MHNWLGSVLVGLAGIFVCYQMVRIGQYRKEDKKRPKLKIGDPPQDVFIQHDDGTRTECRVFRDPLGEDIRGNALWEIMPVEEPVRPGQIYIGVMPPHTSVHARFRTFRDD